MDVLFFTGSRIMGTAACSAGYIPGTNKIFHLSSFLWGIRVLALKGIDSLHRSLNARDEFGSSPLHFASSRGHADMARALVDAGCNPLATNNDGRRASGVTGIPSLSEYLAEAEASYVRYSLMKKTGKKDKRSTTTATTTDGSRVRVLSAMTETSPKTSVSSRPGSVVSKKAAGVKSGNLVRKNLRAKSPLQDK